jgi:hypothetical protein
MNQTSEGIGGVPGTISEPRNGIVGKPAPMAALFSFPAPAHRAGKIWPEHEYVQIRTDILFRRP